MKFLTTSTPLDELTGAYGQAWKTGLLSEHLHLAEANPALRVHTGPTGRVWVVPAAGGTAVPVVCSEIIAVDTEDGPVSGRCGLPADFYGACQGHAEERDHWTSLSEAERLFLERQDEVA